MNIDITRQRDRDEFERRYRADEEIGLPFGPLDLPEQLGVEMACAAHELFMGRVFFGRGVTTPALGFLGAPAVG